MDCPVGRRLPATFVYMRRFGRRGVFRVLNWSKSVDTLERWKCEGRKAVGDSVLRNPPRHAGVRLLRLERRKKKKKKKLRYPGGHRVPHAEKSKKKSVTAFS